MSVWYSKDLGDGVDAFAPTGKMQEAFMAVFMLAQGPIDMALFSKYDRNTNIVTAYFSPSARTIAEMFGAAACDKPSRAGIGLLCGDQRCWEILFPGESSQRE